MIKHRPVAELGGGDLGRLKALHHFHIAGHGNPAHQPLGNLYVRNDDDISPGAGFPPHPGPRCRDHHLCPRRLCLASRQPWKRKRRSYASGRRAGDERGAGIQHAETGAPDQRTESFQIWLHPRRRGGAPRWGTKPFPKSDRAGRLVVLASGFAEDTDGLAIGADARVLGATLTSGQSITYDMAPGRKAYLVATSGRVSLDDVLLEARDGAAVRDERTLRVAALADTEIVLGATLTSTGAGQTAPPTAPVRHRREL